uniref:Centrosomal protein of 63 kDa n=1 Tax=Lygus hesperus TaxID=30085 RepID=A0A0A9YLU0_LYGHE
MKTKTANKGPKEPISRKPKRPDRKYIYGKEKTEDKKQRRPIQKNRFTSIEELQNPARNMSLELFGSLIFNLDEETSDLQISDSTGDYELRVSNDTLKEFKLKVLLGIDHRSKPKFTILLGDCQCYPELPEGTLDLQSRRRYVEEESISKRSDEKVNVEENEEHHPIGTGQAGDYMETQPEKDAEEPRIDVPAVDGGEISRSQLPEQGDADDELTQPSRKPARTKNVEKVGKQRSREHTKNSQVNRQRQYKMHNGASTYMNNLEGFIQFLMNDEICYSALADTRAPPNVTKVSRRIVGGRNLIKYSDGKEFLITFEEKDRNTEGKKRPENKNESSSCPPNSVKSDSDDNLSTLRELLSASDDKTGRRLEEEARAREELIKANEFVETVKNEIIEWQARCEEAIDVTIVCNEEAVTSTEKPMENLNVEVSDVLKALQKVEDVYEDATSDSSNVAQADSLEQFFLELDEYEKMAVSKETNITVAAVEKGLAPENLNNGNTDATSGKSEVSHFQHRYVPPNTFKYDLSERHRTDVDGFRRTILF